MKRIAVLAVVMGLVVLAVAPGVEAYAPTASVSPSSGPAGSSVTVVVSGFTPNSSIEVHSGSYGGGLLAVGTTNGSGGAGVGVVIPGGTPAGGLTLAVCETQFAACTDTTNEFWIGATTTFTVTSPPPPTTTTTTVVVPPPTTTTITFPPDTTPPATVAPLTLPSAAGCEIPDGAIRIDFDDLPSDATAASDEVRTELAGTTGFYLFQLDHTTINDNGRRVDFGPVLESGPSGQQPDISDSAALSRDTTPWTWLGSSSPPNILRSVDDAHFSVASYRTLHGEMDYFGFNLGFGHYGEGFDRPEYLQYDVSISMLPVLEADGSLTEAAWDPVTVTLGPGPQAVTNCVLLENTGGVGYPGGSTWKIDIVPRNLDGSPAHVILEIDDVFYGTNAPAPVGCAIPADAEVISFDDLGAGLHLFGTTDWYATEGGYDYVIGAYEYATIRPDGRAMLFDGPFRSSPGAIDAVPSGTSSPPYALLSDGVREIMIAGWVPSYVGLNMGWLESDKPSVLDLIATGDPITFDIRVRQIPLVTTEGTLTSDLGSASVELGPEFTPVDQCVIIPLTYTELLPGFSNTEIDIVASRRGVPGDWTIAIDDVFFGFAEAPAATHPEAVPAPAAAEVTLPSVPAPFEVPPTEPLPTPSGLPWTLGLGLGVAGLILGAGAMWRFRRD